MRTPAKLFRVFLCTILVSCTSPGKFEDRLQEKNCEQALEAVPENQTDYRLVSKVQEASGTVLSYSATGAAYTVEILWDVTATIGAVTILCAPGIALAVAGSAASQSTTGPVPMACLPGDLKVVQSPNLGKNAYRQTEDWRCPPVDGVSRSIRKVAQCFLDRGGAESREKAWKALESVTQSGSFYRCLSTDERTAFLKDLERAKGAP